MNTRLVKMAAGLGAVSAMAFGGVALATGSTSNPAPPPAAPAAPAAPATDNDSVQDENGADDATEPKGAENETSEANEGPETNNKADTDNIQDENGADDATETNGAEESEGAEVPGDDGPGGHADEPANPTADHQNEGAE